MRFAVRQSQFAAALCDPSRAAPDGLLSPRGVVDAGRFAVYRNNVFVGLTEALARRFPVTRQLVGEDFFAGMARTFAAAEKPASPLLFGYGDGLPDFIAGFPPAANLLYLADVARVEAAWTRGYHAADAVPLRIEALAALAPEQMAGARLLPHPAASVIGSVYPIASIWAAHQSEHVAPLSRGAAETVLIARPGFDVSVHLLPTCDSAFADALFAGATLGEAAERGAAAHDHFNFGTALTGLVGLGAFGAIKMGGTT